jgi:hypothetical protein
MSKHTPGPWTFNIMADGSFRGGDGRHLFDWIGRTEEEALANAALVVFAPDLLKAARAVVAADAAVETLLRRGLPPTAEEVMAAYAARGDAGAALGAVIAKAGGEP